MKKITAGAVVYGPYQSVATLDDRYRCDGADLPFSVVGSGTVDDWAGPLPEPEVVVVVPESVSRFQAQAALYLAGLLDDVELLMNDAGTPALAKLAWANALEFKRTSPTISAMSALLGMTGAQIDQLFITAAQIDA